MIITREGLNYLAWCMWWSYLITQHSKVEKEMRSTHVALFPLFPLDEQARR